MLKKEKATHPQCRNEGEILKVIKTHPELNRVAVKNSCDAAYIVWCVLRDYAILNSLSSHYITSHARNVCMDMGLTFTIRHWRRIWLQGNNIFWNRSKGKIHLRSFKRVYNRLADNEAGHVPSPSFVNVSIEKSSQKRRATLYWSWFVNRGEVTLSRATITEIFQLSPNQQRNYEKILGDSLLIKTNYVHIDKKLYEKKPRNLPEHSFSFEHETFRNNRVEIKREIAYQMPNTFIARDLCSGESPVTFAPRRALKASRTLYGNTEHSYTPLRYVKHQDLWKPELGYDTIIRTFYQGTKRINRLGHYNDPL